MTTNYNNPMTEAEFVEKAKRDMAAKGESLGHYWYENSAGNVRADAYSFRSIAGTYGHPALTVSLSCEI